ncbi:MAG: AAA-like domain-containing protein [Verrucomicrobia bacterium]|nr:AAA-like domain-containing protein [Verrucomicrobiota bacterium]
MDDVAENREVLTQTLEPAGYKISAAPDGEIALKIVSKSAPDLILCDLLMPGINGFEVCRRLKANEETASIPVIFITANSEMESVLHGFEVGAVDFISKPFKTQEVLVRAETHLKVHRMSRELAKQNRELTELNAKLRAEMSRRQQAEQSLAVAVEGQHDPFHTSGTLRHDAHCYVEREADRDLMDGLLKGEFCYVLTSRQMGKSSLMARAANRLGQQGVHVATIDLTALGQNLTLEQWYDGLLSRIGRRLGLEDELDDYWLRHTRLNPVQRFFSAIREIVLEKRDGSVVLFVDELDVVRSLPFSTDEFFGAIRECYNRRTEDDAFNRLTFCLLGVATPSELMTDSRMTPFNIGRRVQLEDFRFDDSKPLRRGLEQAGFESSQTEALLERVFHWTLGHPYLTQRLCRALADSRKPGDGSPLDPVGHVDELCQRIFLSPRAVERDDNLIFVRERLLRSAVEIEELLGVYEKIAASEPVTDDEENPVINQLHLSGIIRCENGRLHSRNRIYETVFNREWIETKRVQMGLRRVGE